MLMGVALLVAVGPIRQAHCWSMRVHITCTWGLPPTSNELRYIYNTRNTARASPSEPTPDARRLMARDVSGHCTSCYWWNLSFADLAAVKQEQPRVHRHEYEALRRPPAGKMRLQQVRRRCFGLDAARSPTPLRLYEQPHYLRSLTGLSK